MQAQKFRLVERGEVQRSSGRVYEFVSGRLSAIVELGLVKVARDGAHIYAAPTTVPTSGGLDRLRLHHVGLDETGAVAQLGRECLALLGVQVGDDHVSAGVMQAPDGRLPEPGRAAADECSC